MHEDPHTETAFPPYPGPGRRHRRSSQRARIFFGLTMIVLGGCWLLSNLGYLPPEWWRFALPSLLMVWGVLTLWRRPKRTGSSGQ